ncbi:hypothetical protein DL764_008615 [Monosporascus ibericus]|uniref:Uncharacterized protein n=1 Tax=Monosporascus ibericus TaxID=155417 RepID=A0A4Q4SZU8_9PEZI|nr:hypothetical protein DL764_008615 [Monosporascus ibericus]
MSDTAESDAPNPGIGEVIKLHPDADISITVYEVPQKTIATFQVIRELLRSQSEKFKVLLDPETPFNEGQKQTWTLEEDTGATTRSLELLFRCMLAGERDTKTELPQSMYNSPVIEIWRVLTLVDIKAQDCVMPGKYLVSSDVIKGWFLGCTGQLEECCPFIAEDPGSRGYHHHMHMPKKVIAQLRKARAGTRTHLENGIYILYKTFINQPNVPCNMSGPARYLEALEATKAYPFEEHRGHNLDNGISALQHFSYKTPDGSEQCRTCAGHVVNRHVQKWASRTTGQFQGLCLRCLRLSVEDRDSYRTCSKFNWHSERDSTWYFSDMKDELKQK